MRSNLLATILLCLLGCGLLHGQSYYFNHYPVERGLSNSAVICSLQDQQGFLWFGTKDGLNRFDGYTFKTFRNDADDPESIGSNFVSCLHQDRQGTLWVGCDRGLFRYDAATESFSRVSAAPPSEIMDIQSDTNGNLWFTTKLTLYRYHPLSGILKAFNQPAPFPAVSLCTTANGALWVSTASGLIGKLDTLSESFRMYDVFEHSSQSGSKWIEEIYSAGNDILLIGTSKHGVKVFDIHSATYKDLPLYDAAGKSDLFVRDFVHYGGNEYWIATESGIFIFNLQTGNWVNLKKNYYDPYSLSDNAVYTLCRDKEGGIWAGTFFGGVNYYPWQYTSFKKYFPQFGINSISGNAVREICQDHYGNLWVGTEDGGLNKLQTATGQFTSFGPSNPRNKVSHTNIHGLLMNGNELWVGTFHHGLDVLDVRTGKRLRHYSAAKNKLKSDFVYCLLKTRAGTIIAATNRGLCAYNPAKDTFMAITQVPETFCTALYEDRNGTIWAGTYSEGVYYFNLRSSQAGNFRYEPHNKNSLSGNRVNQVFEDSRRQLWVATEGGLSRLDHHKGTFANYTTKDGFPSNIIYSVLEDGKQNFWISTSKGLVCFTPATKKLEVYTKESGLLCDQFNYNSAYKDSAGRMYFGSVKGLISFNPDAFIKNQLRPSVCITGFQVHDKEVAINKQGSPLQKSITYTPSITLQHNQSSFSIDFAALSYTAPEMTEYAYKLEGLDKDWTYLKTNRKAYFTELPPGTYTFRVKATISNGVWDSQPAVLTIKILPPFWESRLAYSLYTVLATIVLTLLIHLYHRRNEERSKRKLELLQLAKEKELYQAKLEFFTNVAHEIRTPLTLIKAPMEKVIKKAEEVPSIKNNLLIMQRNTDRLLDLTNQLLDFRKIEARGFHLHFTPANISELLKDICSRFRPTAEQKKLHFELLAPESLRAHVDTEALNKILSNLLTNAIKYAHSRVSIHLLPNSAGDSVYAIEVKNDGLLVPDGMKDKIFETFFRLKETEKISGTGIGLALSRSLAELHQGTLEMADPQDDLNVFRLTLPVQPQKEASLNTPTVEAYS